MLTRHHAQQPTHRTTAKPTPSHSQFSPHSDAGRVRKALSSRLVLNRSASITAEIASTSRIRKTIAASGNRIRMITADFGSACALADDLLLLPPSVPNRPDAIARSVLPYLAES